MVLCLSPLRCCCFSAAAGCGYGPGGARFGHTGAMLRSKGALLLTVIFGLYTFQFMAMAGLLPTLLVQRAGLSVAAAGIITAITWIANAVGTASAGFLLRAGAPMWAVVFGAFSPVMGVAACGVFSASLPLCRGRGAGVREPRTDRTYPRLGLRRRAARFTRAGRCWSWCSV